MFDFISYIGDEEDEVVATIKVPSSLLITTLQRFDEYGIAQDVKVSCKTLEEHYSGISNRVFDLILDELRNNSAFQDIIDQATREYIKNYNPLNLTQTQ